MKPALDDRTYYLKQFRKGWRARVRDSKATGWGVTPELAIYDWRKQHAALVVSQQPTTKSAA